MNPITPETTVAPSAPIVPATVTPSVPAKAPETLADFAALASASLQVAAHPAPAPASGSPAEEVADPSPVVTDDPGNAPAEAETQPESDDLAEPGPTAEELASLSESEQRIFGALQKEREKRREARAEVKAMRAELEALKSQLTATPPEPVKEAAPPEATPASPSAPSATVLPGDPLGDCNNFDQIDARVMQAASLEAQVMRLQQQLTRDGAEAVKAALTAAGVKDLRGVPLEAADDVQIGDFLTRVYEGTRVTQAGAEPRKRYLTHQSQAFQSATTLIPELTDAKSVRAKEFKEFVAANPWLPRLGPNWPVIAATHLLGQVAVKQMQAKANGKPAEPPVPPVAKVATAKAAPAKPTRSASSLPQPNESDAIIAKMNAGTASMAEIAQYASRGLTSRS